MTDNDLDEYERGYLDALADYSYRSSQEWAENGVRYVGTTGTTFKDARKAFLDARGKASE